MCVRVEGRWDGEWDGWCIPFDQAECVYLCIYDCVCVYEKCARPGGGGVGGWGQIIAIHLVKVGFDESQWE